MGKQFQRRGAGREKQMPKCSSSADRWSWWLTCLLIKSSCFRRLSQGYCENATHSAKIRSEWLQGPVWTPSYWAEAADTAGWTLLYFFFIFFFFFFHMKPKHYILASETCEMWVQLTVQSCTFTAFGAHQTSWAPRVVAIFSLDPTAGLLVALPPKEQGLIPALQQSPTPSGLFFSNQSTPALAENGTRNASPPQIWV